MTVKADEAFHLGVCTRPLLKKKNNDIAFQHDEHFLSGPYFYDLYPLSYPVSKDTSAAVRFKYQIQSQGFLFSLKHT